MTASLSAKPPAGRQAARIARGRPIARSARCARRAALVAIAACASISFALAAGIAGQRFPDVLSAEVRASADGTYDFDVTVSSPYDTAARYADGFRVTTSAGRVLGERKLWHDHRDEQPFTRDLHSVKIPPEVKTVVIQARDRQHGYGGRSIEIRLPGR